MTISSSAINYHSQQWQSYAVMLIASVGVVFAGWFSGFLVNQFFPLPAFAVDALEFLGYILWGTGMARPKISHLTQCIPSKALNRRLQLFCAEVGIFAFVMARTLVPLS